ncbi:MAG: NUDIX hydrolase, partial [Nannocystaceae bacterium]|nr:NUDIX hydrolase [Nannocystaceae bacterium]
MADDPIAAPRHAATVVVARPTPRGDDAEIFMVRRSAKSPFMPSTLVFPGGRLDPEDGPPQRDDSWDRAARRETAEEIGIALEVDLLWFDTWLTPSAESRRRYLTRFYWASIARDAGDHAQADGHETHEGRWATATAHLEQWEAQEVDLPPPTLATLLRLAPLGLDAAATLDSLKPQDVILPKVTAAQGGVQIVMPHDPEYADLPGEAAPAPARAYSLPTRFSRLERVWTPVSQPS